MSYNILLKSRKESYIKSIEKGAKTKRVGGGRGLTLARIVLHHNKKFRGAHPKRERNGKTSARLGIATVLP
jgi:hypothetical protein